MSSDTLTNIKAARALTKAAMSDDDIFYVVDPQANSGEKSKGIVASELLSFTGGDVTGSTDGNLTIGSDKVSKSMLKQDAAGYTVVDLTSDTTLTAAHANSVLYCNTTSGAIELTINDSVFSEGDWLYISHAGSDDNNVTLAGTETFKRVNGVDGNNRALTTSGIRTALFVRFISNVAVVSFDESHEAFDIGNFTDSTQTTLANTDELVFNPAGAGPAKTITGRATKNVEAVALNAANITVGATRVNKTIIVTRTGTSTSNITITSGIFKAGDWFAVLKTGNTTGAVKILNTGVDLFTAGETVDGSYTVNDQYGFVTVYCYEDDKFVLLGNVSKV